MGNTQSGGGFWKNRKKKKFLKDIKKTAKKDINVVSAIDSIATKFILQSNFQDMLKLQDKSYCDKLTILTKKIIEKQLSPREILYLDFRTKKGQTVNLLTREHFSFIDGNKLPTFDINSKVKKERICMGIARFYITFFHLFASIVKAINPVYTYKDSTGKTVHIDLLEKMNIPPELKKQRELLGICKLKYKNLTPVQDNNNGVIVAPKFCQKKSQSLCQQPGIKELKKLYFDEFDYDPKSPTSGTYYRMSKKMKENYEKDVKLFYKAFTGEVTVPDDIKDFCDINTFDFSKLVSCSENEKHFSYKGPKKNVSIRKYGKQLNKMMINTSDNQKKLLGIIDKMFSYDVDIQHKVKELTINPELNNESLKDLIKETRDIIIKMFIDCENNYKKAIKLFRAITLDKKLKRDISRINRHKEMEEKIISQNDDILKSPEPLPEKLPVSEPILPVSEPSPELPVGEPSHETILPVGEPSHETILPVSEPSPEPILPVSEPSPEPMLPVSEPSPELHTVEPIEVIPKSESKDLGNTFNNPSIIPNNQIPG